MGYGWRDAGVSACVPMFVEARGIVLGELLTLFFEVGSLAGLGTESPIHPLVSHL